MHSDAYGQDGTASAPTSSAGRSTSVMPHALRSMILSVAHFARPSHRLIRPSPPTGLRARLRNTYLEGSGGSKIAEKKRECLSVVTPHSLTWGLQTQLQPSQKPKHREWQQNKKMSVKSSIKRPRPW